MADALPTNSRYASQSTVAPDDAARWDQLAEAKRRFRGRGADRESFLEGVHEDDGASIVRMPFLQCPGTPPSRARWAALAGAGVVGPLLGYAIVAMASATLAFDNRVLVGGMLSIILGYGGAVAAYHSRRRSAGRLKGTSGFAGLVATDDTLTLHYPHGAFAVPWSAVRAASVRSTPEALITTNHKQLVHQLVLTLDGAHGPETLIVYEAFDATDAQPGEAGRKGLELIYGVATWLSARIDAAP